MHGPEEKERVTGRGRKVGHVSVETRETVRLHVLSCIEQIMPLKVFQSLVESIPEHPAHFRDSHPIRMVYEAVSARCSTSELHRFFQDSAWDWERMVIAWAFQRLLYEISRHGDESEFRQCLGGRIERILQLDAAKLCRTGLLCLSGQWYSDPEIEGPMDFPPPEKHFNSGAVAH